MAFGTFWRGERQRFGADRDRDRWRSGSDWREGRERDYERQGAGRQERGWSPSGEYYSDRDYGTEGYGGERYRGQGGREFGEGSWEQQGRGMGGGRDWSEHGRSYLGGGGDWREEGRGEYGERGYYGGREGLAGSEFEYRRSPYGRESEYARHAGYGGLGGEYGYGGLYRGRGPRGYRRSDDRIREDVCDWLTDDPQIDASSMEVTVKDAEVTLSGSVNSREEKRRAEDLVEAISGVKDVHNNLRVMPQQKGTETTTGEKTTTQSPRH